MALRNRILALWIWMMQAFQLVMCRDWKRLENDPFVRSFNFLARTLNQRKFQEMRTKIKKKNKKQNKPEHCCYIYVCVCSCAHMGIYNVFVCCLSAEGQRWTLGIFSKPDSKSLTSD